MPGYPRYVSLDYTVVLPSILGIKVWNQDFLGWSLKEMCNMQSCVKTNQVSDHITV
jgi:hypothetical protein